MKVRKIFSPACKALVASIFLVPSMVAFAATSSLEISCQSPLGTFHLTGDAETGTSSFELENKDQILSDQLTACKTSLPCKFEYLVKKGSGGWLQVKAHELVETIVEGHYVCHPSRSPAPCHSRGWVPEHYEWQEGRAVSLELSPLLEEQYKTELFFFRHYPVKGLLALGPDATCSVRRSGAADK